MANKPTLPKGLPKRGTLVRVVTRHPTEPGPDIAHTGHLISEGQVTIYHKKTYGADGQFLSELSYLTLRRQVGREKGGSPIYVFQNIPSQNVISVSPAP